jgi:hypothetical protein
VSRDWTDAYLWVTGALTFVAGVVMWALGAGGPAAPWVAMSAFGMAIYQWGLAWLTRRRSW